MFRVWGPLALLMAAVATCNLESSWQFICKTNGLRKGATKVIESWDVFVRYLYVGLHSSMFAVQVAVLAKLAAPIPKWKIL